MATRTTGPPRRLEEALLRRFELARSGFHYDIRRGQWRRGRLALSDEQVDMRRAWQRSVQGWMRTKPPRRRHHFTRERKEGGHGVT